MGQRVSGRTRTRMQPSLHWATSSSVSENRRSECEVAGVQKKEDLATAHFLFAQQLCGNGRAAVAR